MILFETRKENKIIYIFRWHGHKVVEFHSDKDKFLLDLILGTSHHIPSLNWKMSSFMYWFLYLVLCCTLRLAVLTPDIIFTLKNHFFHLLHTKVQVFNLFSLLCGFLLSHFLLRYHRVTCVGPNMSSLSLLETMFFSFWFTLLLSKSKISFGSSKTFSSSSSFTLFTSTLSWKVFYSLFSSKSSYFSSSSITSFSFFSMKL